MNESNQRTVRLRENLFHKLLDKHRKGVQSVLSQLLPLEGMQEASSEIFPRKIPDKVFISVDWEENPRMLFLDLTIEVEPDDIYKMNVYRSWGLEQVSGKLPRRRKYHEPEERVHGALFSIFTPRADDTTLARQYHVDVISLQEGLPIDLPPSKYLEVGAPFVLGKLAWEKQHQAPQHWLRELQNAAQLFREDTDEIAFLLGWGRNE